MSGRFLIGWSVALVLVLFSRPALQAQCISGDCVNGKGTYVYPSGARYTGEFRNGEIHGRGKCHFADGSTYDGQWSNRYPDGYGTLTTREGTIHTGYWKKGHQVDEQGHILEPRGGNDDGTTVQSGCISGDCINGQGAYAYPDGSKYQGEFRNGKIEGQGTWFFPNGDRYTGSFKNNFSHGNGTIFHTDGTITRGTWRYGEYLGEQTSEKEQYGCIEGNCFNGRGTFIYKDSKARYVGQFRDSLPEGEGAVYYSNGEYYKGQWLEGSFHGSGTLYLKDGNAVDGYWERGTYVGTRDETNDRIESTARSKSDTAPAAIAPKGSAPASTMKVWAVIVGISSYNHMPVLRYTDDDAYRMFAFFKSPEGGAVPDDQIRILIDEEATRNNILATMEGIFTKAAAGDLVILYFSGHGLKGAFLPIDYDGYNNKLFHEEINEAFRNSLASYKLCIADACHSGSLLSMKGANIQSTLNSYYESLAKAQPGTALIMSSKSEETSLESSGLRQGVFSHFLIRGLKGEADANRDGIVTVQELYRFISDNVRAYTGNRQSPVIQGDYDPKMTISVLRD